MHVTCLVLPVPAAQRDRYHDWAAHSARLLADLGCVEQVTCWEDRVPDGERTDFRRAVAAEAGEKIVVVWQLWPDRETLAAAEAALATDPRFDVPDDLPFDPRRAILGTFAPLHATRADLAPEPPARDVSPPEAPARDAAS